VIVAGGNITVNGKVLGSVRAAGGNITVSGPVAGDVVVAGGTVNLTSEATIGRDLVLAVGMATVAGPVDRRILASGGNLTLQNKVGGDVTARVDRLRLDPGAQIRGNLDYTSRNSASIASGARVSGSTTRHVPRDTTGGATGGFIGWVRALIGIFALGLLLLLLFPGFSTTAADTLERSPLPSLGIGCAVLVATPIVALIAFVLGLIIGGWWIALFLVAAYLLALAVGYVVSGLLLGRLVFTRLGWGRYHAILMLLGGLFILAVIGAIPVIGGLIGLAAVVFGVGALSIALSRWLPRTRGATTAA
jgi:cytoskeletal protein CcmA (bactofilin family)